MATITWTHVLRQRRETQELRREIAEDRDAKQLRVELARLTAIGVFAPHRDCAIQFNPRRHGGSRHSKRPMFVKGVRVT